jgi:hypothetical protein
VLAGGMRRSIIALPVQAELLVLGCTASPWGVKKCPSVLLIIESPSLVSRVGRNPNLMRALGWTGSVGPRKNENESGIAWLRSSGLVSVPGLMCPARRET